MLAWLVVVTSLLSVILILMIVGLALYFRQLGRAIREMELTLRTVREEIVPLSDDARQVLRRADGLLITTQGEVERIGRVTAVAERLVEGRVVVDVASKAVTSSRSTISSVLEGIKQGLKVLRSTRDESKEESGDE